MKKELVCKNCGLVLWGEERYFKECNKGKWKKKIKQFIKKLIPFQNKV